MEKLGLKDGEHIESGFITRSIENAQKKVENLHFESRKHILEYDDVANEQRKLIYQFRNRLLDENYDLSHKIAEDREFALNNILGNLTDLESGSVEDFDALQSQIAEFFGVALQNIAQDLNLNDLKEQILAQIASDYESKMSVLDAEQRGEIERIIYLQVLDSAWREHLYVMDNLKTGIGLRGYNQKDPLIEYKKESYNLFLELKDSLKIDSAKMIHIIKLRAKSDEDEERARKMLESMESQNDNVEFNKDNDSTTNATKLTPIRSKKIARNDPCPCGSGKKYKLCHGKSGPKVGELAK